MKTTLLTFYLLAFSLLSVAQTEFTVFPKDHQLYPRDLKTNKGSIKIDGVTSVNQKLEAIKAVLSYSSSGKEVNSSTSKLSYRKGIAFFHLTLPINAELNGFDLKVYGISEGQEQLLKEARDLVAGDAFIINGQSNSVANSYGGSAHAELSNFIRSFGTTMHDSTAGSDLNWYYAVGDSYSCPGVIGQWGLKTANAIVRSQNIPVAVIAGGVGGTHLLQHMRTDSNPENLNSIYGRLLFRVRAAGLQNNIRAIWWHQGETDAYYQRNVAQYKELWNTLKLSWIKDYPGIEHYFTFQIRHGCGVWRNFGTMVMEAQRQLAMDSSNVSVISTNGIDQNIDYCHFQYEPGYSEFANRLIPVVLNKIYKQPHKQHILSPNIISATTPDAISVVLTFANCDTLIMEPGSVYDFKIEGASIHITSATVDKNQIILHLSSPVRGPVSVSYYNHPGPGSPYIKTSSGNGLLSFYSFPVN